MKAPGPAGAEKGARASLFPDETAREERVLRARARGVSLPPDSAGDRPILRDAPLDAPSPPRDPAGNAASGIDPMSSDRSWSPPEPPLGVLPFVGALVVALFAILSVRVAEDVAKKPAPVPVDGNSLLPKELAESDPEPSLPEPPVAELKLSGPATVLPGGSAELRITARSLGTRAVRIALPAIVTATACGEAVTATVSPSGATSTLQPKDDRILATVSLPPMPCRRGFGWGVVRADVEVAWTDGSWPNVQPLTATWQVREPKK